MQYAKGRYKVWNAHIFGTQTFSLELKYIFAELKIVVLWYVYVSKGKETTI